MRRRVVIFLVLLFFLFGVVNSVSAEWVFSSIKDSAAARDAAEEGALNLEASTQKTIDELFVSLNCSLGGTGCTNDPEKFRAFYDRSVLGVSQKAITLAYSFPPASSSNYIAFMGSKAGLINKTYAQGIGYSGLRPIIGIWSAMRNVTYVIIAVLVAVIGILIMFRKSLDSQTVLTFQMAIPRVIITIILITFSYAIAGMVVDLIYFSILFIVQIFETSHLLDPGKILRAKSDFTTGSWWTIFDYTLKSIPVDEGGIFSGGVGVLSGLIGGPLGILSGGVGFVVGALVGAAYESATSGGSLGLNFVGNIVSPFVMLIVFIGIISIAFRLIWMLINAYLQLIINIIFAPIMLLGDIFSGGTSFLNWFTNLLGYAVVYPATALMLLTAYVINTKISGIGTFWTAPLVPGFSSEMIGMIIGVGILFLTPQIIKSIQKIFKPSPPVPVTAGSAFAPATSGYNMALNLFQTYKLFRPSQLLNEETQKGLVAAAKSATDKS